jgi:transcriptional regulator with XRE-family HTH domain
LVGRIAARGHGPSALSDLLSLVQIAAIAWYLCGQTGISEEVHMSSVLACKIRKLRRELGLTIREVADRSGLAVSMISQVERGIVSPSILSLRRIGGALNVPAFYFLIEGSDLDGIVVRVGERKTLRLPGYDASYQLLSPTLDKRVEVIFFELPPGGQSCEVPMAHSGEEHLTVLSGRLKVIMPDREAILEEGDCIYFNEMLPHQVINIGDRLASAICAISPPSF